MLWLTRFTLPRIIRRRVALALPLIAAAACGDDPVASAPRRAPTQRASTTVNPNDLSLSVTPGTLTFGPQAIGTVTYGEVTVRNTGSVAALVDVFSPDAPFNSMGDNCGDPPVLVPNATCTVWLSFAPVSAGLWTRTLIIQIEGSNSPQVVTLNGIALGTPAIGVTPSIGFGSVPLGTGISRRPLKVTNTGSAPLVLGSLTLGGTNAGDFAISEANNCIRVPAVSLYPGQSCTASVNFEPLAVGARSATVTITHNAPGGPVTVSLGGTGVKRGGYIP